MALSNRQVFNNQTRTSATELLAQQVEKFNAASGGAIVLSTGKTPGDYAEEALVSYTANLVRRRNAYGTGSPSKVVIAEVLHKSVKVAAGTALRDGYAAVDASLAYEPTALLAPNDPTALGALARLRELDLRVPEDISLTGFGDIPYARYANPPLTTVRVQRFDLGARAWSMMRSLMAGEPVATPPLLPGELVLRATSGPPREGALGRAAR